MMRPWCVVIEQNVQPPKQPRMIVTESRIIVGGDRLAVRGMRRARVGQVVDRVHLALVERQRRRVHHDDAVAVALDEAPRVERVGLVVDHARGVGERAGGPPASRAATASKRRQLEGVGAAPASLAPRR